MSSDISIVFNAAKNSWMDEDVTMRTEKRLMFRVAVLAGLVGSVLNTPAYADAIDGDWCDGTRRITIEGSSITTPGGSKIQGQYGRHDAQFSVPPGEPGAGGVVEMTLMGEEHVEVKFAGEPVKVWRRCKNTS